MSFRPRRRSAIGSLPNSRSFLTSAPFHCKSSSRLKCRIGTALMVKAGGKDGRPLSARTVGHAHRVLHRALQRAVENETLSRNVASVIRPPNVEAQEVEILSADEIRVVLAKLEGHALHPIVALALATGMRRGELLALRWEDVDFDGAKVRIERSLEETAAGLRFKAPKTKHGRRTISLPTSAVEALRVHRLKQLELRIALGRGSQTPTSWFSAPSRAHRYRLTI